MKRSGIAVFDVDGSLRLGGIAAWPEFLLKKKLFTKEAALKCRQDLEKAKTRKITYRRFVIDILNHMAEGLKGKPPAKIKKAAEEFVKNPALMQLHPYAVELVERMNSRGITVAITGQPHELAEAFMRVLPFHISIGTEFEVLNGQYTGKVKRNMALEKGTFIKELRKHKNYWKGISYGFGDRVTDKRMLESTTKSIALNPDEKMERLARKKGWSVAKGKNILKRIKRGM